MSSQCRSECSSRDRRQAPVELVGTGKDASSSVERSLKLVSRDTVVRNYHQKAARVALTVVASVGQMLILSTTKKNKKSKMILSIICDEFDTMLEKLLHCALAAVQCIVIGPVCGWHGRRHGGSRVGKRPPWKKSGWAMPTLEILAVV